MIDTDSTKESSIITDLPKFGVKYDKYFRHGSYFSVGEILIRIDITCDEGKPTA